VRCTCLIGIDVSEGGEEALVHFEHLLVGVSQLEAGLVFGAEGDWCVLGFFLAGLEAKEAGHFLIEVADVCVEVSHGLCEPKFNLFC
jgi:hypothetical protein